MQQNPHRAARVKLYLLKTGSVVGLLFALPPTLFGHGCAINLGLRSEIGYSRPALGKVV